MTSSIGSMPCFVSSSTSLCHQQNIFSPELCWLPTPASLTSRVFRRWCVPSAEVLFSEELALGLAQHRMLRDSSQTWELSPPLILQVCLQDTFSSVVFPPASSLMICQRCAASVLGSVLDEEQKASPSVFCFFVWIVPGEMLKSLHPRDCPTRPWIRSCWVWLHPPWRARTRPFFVLPPRIFVAFPETLHRWLHQTHRTD